MAYITGTSTDATDLYNKLIAFLKTDATLVAAAQNWAEVWSAPVGAPNLTDKVLRGPGLSGADQVYIGLRLEETAPGDSYRINIVGMSGIIASATEYNQHVNVSTPVGVMLDVNPMTHWFVASGRRFIFAAKMSTIFQMGYGGLFLPYGDPVNFPYPLFVGGTTRIDNTSGYVVNTWRSTSDSHRAFPHGLYVSGVSDSYPPALMLDPLGQWQEAIGAAAVGGKPIVIGPCNFGGDGGNFDVRDGIYNVGGNIGYGTVRYNMAPCFDGSYALTPFTLIQPSPAQIYGVLDGIYNVPGQGNSSENTVTIGGVNHLVVQNVFRTAIGDYMALKLE